MKQLILVHGYLGSSMNWGPTISKLKQSSDLSGWTFKAVDLLGHAHRPLDESRHELGIEELTLDFEKQLPHGTFYGLGHSFGLRPLLKFDSLFPGRLKGIIAEDCIPEITQEGSSFLKKIIYGSPSPFKSREEAKRYFDENYGEGSPLARFLLSNIKELSPEKHDWRFNINALKSLLNEAIKNNMWKEWENFSGPIEMITGEYSNYLNHQLIQKAISCRKLSTHHYQIPRSNHWVHSDQLVLFVDCVVKILKSFA